MFTVTDAALIGATLIAPVLAVQVQKYLERWRAENERRNNVFKTLMSTRTTRLAPAHVSALNLINIEFSGKKTRFRKVRSAWKAYFTHLGDPVPSEEAHKPVFFAKREELFTDMLYEMGAALDYDFDKTEISKEVYGTIYHKNLEEDQELLRKKLVEILTGKAAIPMAVVSFLGDPESAANQADYLKIMAEHLRDGKPWPITIVGDDVSTGKVVPLRPDQQNEAKAARTDAK
jgi:hypothetical protein